MFYAPLRTLIWEDRAGHAWFTADQPSAQFATLEIREVQTVREELDRKLVRLLADLEVLVPDALKFTTKSRGSPPAQEVPAGAGS